MASAKPKTASLSVNFSISTESDTDTHLSAQIDDREKGLNCGDTSFAPGDRAGWLLFKGSRITSTTITSSYGTNESVLGTLGLQYIFINQPDTDNGQTEPDETEFVTFTDEDLEASVKYPIHTYFGGDWVGNPPPGESRIPTIDLETGKLSLGKSNTASGSGCTQNDPENPTNRWVAIWRPDYKAAAFPYYLVNTLISVNGQPLKEYEIGIRIVGSVT